MNPGTASRLRTLLQAKPKLTCVILNSQTPCPPRGAVPVYQACCRRPFHSQHADRLRSWLRPSQRCRARLSQLCSALSTTIALCLGLFTTVPCRAFYNANAGRWLSRDPINELGPQLIANSPTSVQNDRMAYPLVYQVAGNETVGRYDKLGLLGLPGCGYGCIPPPDPRPPPIDCSGYSRAFGASPCRTCESGKFGSKKDTYPERAQSICEGFQARYTTTPFQTEAACVASCLIAEESSCQEYGWCDARNCCRLQAHVRCYAKCAFVPIMGMPRGGPALGWQELIPACKRLGMSNLDILISGLF